MENAVDAPTPSSHMSGFKMPKTDTEPQVRVTEGEAMSFSENPGIKEPVESKAENFEDIVKDKTPQEIKDIADKMSYEDRVKAFDMTLDDAMYVVDSLVTNGEYRETVKLSKKLEVVIGTRDTRYNSYLSKIIDLEGPKRTGRLNQLMTEYQLAGSLVSFGKTTLPELKTSQSDKEWEEVVEVRVGFIRQLQGPIFLTLCNKLAKFDSKMMIVFSDGYDENF